MSNLQSTALVTLQLLQTPVPDGKTFAKIAIVVTDSAGTAVEHDVDGVAVTTATFDVSALAAGAITIVASALATDGTVLASATGTATLTAAPPVTFPAPVTLTVALS